MLTVEELEKRRVFGSDEEISRVMTSCPLDVMRDFRIALLEDGMKIKEALYQLIIDFLIKRAKGKSAPSETAPSDLQGE